MLVALYSASYSILILLDSGEGFFVIPVAALFHELKMAKVNRQYHAVVIPMVLYPCAQNGATIFFIPPEITLSIIFLSDPSIQNISLWPIQLSLFFIHGDKFQIDKAYQEGPAERRHYGERKTEED